MIKVKVMCHRPRTQRQGIDSEDRELEVFRGTKREAKKVLADARKAKKEIVAAGYPWHGGMAHGFQTLPNDEFYLRID